MSQRRPLLFIFATIALDTIGFGIIIPVIPALITDLTGEGLDTAAIYGGWLMFVYAGIQFFCAPVMGNLGDRFGRRPVLLCALAVLATDYLIMALAPTLVWLFVGRTLTGIAGATATTASAYVADISGEEDRARNFGLISAAWGMGFVLGPVIGGLLGEIGPRVPFFAAAGLTLANLAFGALVLPESLPPGSRRAFDWRRANPLGALRALSPAPGLLILAAGIFVYQIGHDANPSVWSYFTMYRFGFGEREVGLSLALVGIASALVHGLLVGRAVTWWGERRTVSVGFVAMGAGFLGMAFAPSVWIFLAMIVPVCMGGIAMPALRSVMAARVGADAQGELHGALTSIASLSAVVAPLVMTRLFGTFSGADAPLHFPGMPFLVAGLALGAALVIIRRGLRVLRLPAVA